jgi:peptide/nickel transport system substrate-binding protein
MITGAFANAYAFALGGLVACAPAVREPGTVVIASGTDLESANPLVTVHTMSRQVQRHMLFVTLVRLDSLLQPIPYFARRWDWDDARRTVTFRLDSTLRWHDGRPTTAADVAFTLDRAADSALGSPRRGDVRVVEQVRTPDPFTLEVRFTSPQSKLPVVFGELPIVPRHLLDTVPTARWRAHPFSTAPVGNGPFRFESRLAGRQWRFVRNESFPAAMGGAPQLRRLVVAVVDEAATKFAGLVSGELDLAGVSPTMARLVREDPALRLMSPPAVQRCARTSGRGPRRAARTVGRRGRGRVRHAGIQRLAARPSRLAAIRPVGQPCAGREGRRLAARRGRMDAAVARGHTPSPGSAADSHPAHRGQW